MKEETEKKLTRFHYYVIAMLFVNFLLLCALNITGMYILHQVETHSCWYEQQVVGREIMAVPHCN